MDWAGSLLIFIKAILYLKQMVFNKNDCEYNVNKFSHFNKDKWNFNKFLNGNAINTVNKAWKNKINP